MTDLVLSTVEPPLATVTLNRPGRHNALVPELLSALIGRTVEVAALPGVESVVLAAKGRSFSTGGDVAGFEQHRDDLAGYASEIVGLLNEAMLTFMRIGQPVVAAVHGAVTGGSLGLVLAADLVVAAPVASFTPWYSVVGFAPDGGWSALLPDRIGRARASSTLFHNSTITAEQALEWGLVDEIAYDAVAGARAVALMLAGSRTRAVKRGLNADLESIALALERERQLFVEQITTDEALAGIDAFLRLQRP
ncbi:MAG: enoyl-CoA hydratase/isomerase family protein [Acidimicrobiia bacterium]